MENMSNATPGNMGMVNCPGVTVGEALGIRYGLVCGLSLVIVIILVFLQRRRQRNMRCLSGYIGIPIPMDFLITPQYRWIYISLFPVMATSLLGIYLGSGRPPIDHYVFSIFWNILFFPAIIVLAFALEYTPLFACADASIPIIGHSLGLFYSVVWYGSVVFTFRVINYVRFSRSCIVGKNNLTVVLNIGNDIPVILLGFYILLWYIYRVIFDVVKLIKSARATNKWYRYYPFTQQPYQLTHDSKEILLTGAHYYHFLHVKRLLSPQQKQDKLKPARGKVVNLIIKIVRFLFPWPFEFKKNFRFPVPFVGAVAAMILILWRFSYTVAFYAFLVIDMLSVPFNEQVVPFIRSGVITNITGITLSDQIIDIVVESGQFIIVGIPVATILSVFLSMLFCIYMITHMMGAVSKHINKAARRGFNTKKLLSPVQRVPAAWKYTGLQIGFFVYAWIIYTIIILLIGIALGVVIFLLKYQASWFIRIALSLLIPSVWSKLVLSGQFLLCKYIFISEQGKFVHITNQRLFNWLAFLLFFYNSIIGFVGAVVRGLISIVFGALLLFRLDRVVLMTGFEFMDFGHRAYIGFLYLNYNYNNAVMHVFISLAQQAVSSKNSLENTLSTAIVYENKDNYLPFKDPAGEKMSYSLGCRSRNRWLIAYTLIKNPSLKKLRASNLLAAASKDVDEQGHEKEFLANVAAIRSKTTGPAGVSETGVDVDLTKL